MLQSLKLLCLLLGQCMHEKSGLWVLYTLSKILMYKYTHSQWVSVVSVYTWSHIYCSMKLNKLSLLYFLTTIIVESAYLHEIKSTKSRHCNKAQNACFTDHLGARGLLKMLFVTDLHKYSLFQFSVEVCLIVWQHITILTKNSRNAIKIDIDMH